MSVNVRLLSDEYLILYPKLKKLMNLLTTNTLSAPKMAIQLEEQDNNSSATEFELCRNAGPRRSAF